MEAEGPSLQPSQYHRFLGMKSPWAPPPLLDAMKQWGPGTRMEASPEVEPKRNRVVVVEAAAAVAAEEAGSRPWRQDSPTSQLLNYCQSRVDWGEVAEEEGEAKEIPASEDFCLGFHSRRCHPDPLWFGRENRQRYHRRPSTGAILLRHLPTSLFPSKG